MNKWQKLGLAVGMGTAVVTTSHIINKFIFESATINNYTGKTVKHTYSWKFGNIAYSTYGNYDNPPLLLIHDLKSYSSGYEWDNTVHYLSKKPLFNFCVSIVNKEFISKSLFSFSVTILTSSVCC